MKVLWLSNSDEVYGDLPPEVRTSSQTARLLEAATGEAVEVIPRVIWPSPQLPDIIDGWMERYSPDIVLFQINGFWYLYGSVPLLFERKLGRVGKQISRAGLKASRTPWIVKTRVFHLGRRIALRTIGAAYYFTPAEVCETVEACVRRIVRHEGAGLVVQGQFAPAAWNSAPPGAIAFVHARVAALCESLHITYAAAEPGKGEDINFWTKGDRLHTSEGGHGWYANRIAAAILPVWEAMGHPRA
ncbi:MAG: hypothetical protein HY875_11575 [Chloroflexi bacterium]|nr:hypothetical protein [Chloroflexota bacterium]